MDPEDLSVGKKRGGGTVPSSDRCQVREDTRGAASEAELRLPPRGPRRNSQDPLCLWMPLNSETGPIVFSLLPFLVAVTHWRLPPPGISENTVTPSLPDLQEEKLRSQLEEEKSR